MTKRCSFPDCNNPGDNFVMDHPYCDEHKSCHYPGCKETSIEIRQYDSILCRKHADEQLEDRGKFPMIRDWLEVQERFVAKVQEIVKEMLK